MASADLKAAGEGGVSRYTLTEGKRAVIGRSSESDWRLEDPRLSRRHAEISLVGGRLRVVRLPEASNPILRQNAPRDEFWLAPGETFAIGKTTFTYLGPAADARPGDRTVVLAAPQIQQTMTAQDLYNFGEHGGQALNDLLDLPELLRTSEPEKFFAHLAELLLRASGASWARIFAADGKTMAEAGPKGLQASKTLVEAAVKDMPRPTLYCWSSPPADIKATVQEGVDWAISAAAPMAGASPLVFYVSGFGGSQGAHRQASRFVGLVADMVGRSLSMRRLETWQGRLSRYFAAPIVSKILESQDLAALKPRLAQSTIMFLDIRGFSRRSEENNEKILSYLTELRGVLTLLTGRVLAENGVVIQYQGDAILACWNLPVADPAHADRACRAALDMAETVAGLGGDWKCGIGLHTGEVVAGSVGSEQVWSYSVMGPVVNLASRIEGITKELEVPILVSGEVAAKVSPATASAVRVGRFRPVGMTAPIDLYELSRPPADPGRASALAEGLKALEAGQWEAAYQALDKLSSQDKVGRYLKSLSEHYRRHPPANWTGVIELAQK